MNVIANHQNYELDYREPEKTIEGIDRIFKALFDDNEIVQEVIIDGQSYREGYNERLVQDALSIQKVEIITVNGHVLMADIIQEIKQYIPRVVTAFDSISELLYGEMAEQEWSYFSQLMEGIQWTYQSAHIMRVHYERYPSDNNLLSKLISFVQAMEEQLPQLEQFLDIKDYTAAGDLLKYEMPECFNELAEAIDEVAV